MADGGRSRINEMAAELAPSQERFAKPKRFLVPQVAELVDRTGNDSVLDGQRAEVVALFCDLRGFAAFSSRAEPEEIMRMLGEYYDALGAMVTKHEATLTSFLGDGIMVLVNASVPRPGPAASAVDLAIDMQRAVQALMDAWRGRGHVIGFGVGLAMGPADGRARGHANLARIHAIGNGVNLASRLCSSAEDGQILVDLAIADAVRDVFPLLPLGTRPPKGYGGSTPVFSVLYGQDMRKLSREAAAS